MYSTLLICVSRSKSKLLTEFTENMKPLTELFWRKFIIYFRKKYKHLVTQKPCINASPTHVRFNPATKTYIHNNLPLLCLNNCFKNLQQLWGSLLFYNEGNSKIITAVLNDRPNGQSRWVWVPLTVVLQHQGRCRLTHR